MRLLLTLTAVLILCAVQIAQSAQVTFSLPDLSAQPGDTLNIPISMSNTQADTGIYSIQFEVIYDHALMIVDTLIFNSALAGLSDWKKEYNVEEGFLSGALAGTDSVESDGLIADVVYIISDSAANDDSSSLVFNNLYVNEGAPPSIGVNGLVRIVVVGIEEIDHAYNPVGYNLAQNYPNPFNPATTIRYSIPQSGDVSLIIYNLLGAEIARLVDGRQPAGEYGITWDASNIPSGIYFYRLQASPTSVWPVRQPGGRAGDFVLTRKMVS